MTMTHIPLRILQVVMDIGRGSGVANVILNWHRNIDRTKIQFDYLVCFPQSPTETFEQEIRSLGGHIFYISYKGLFHPWAFLKSIVGFFKNHTYKLIHSHVTALGAFYYPIAKFYGTQIIIQHAHLTTWSDKKLSALRNYLCLHAVWPLIDYKVACSDAAGKSYFRKNYLVINNGIDLEKFRFNPKIREQIRAKLNLQDKFVVGHIGRFVPQKNHFFLIDIFEQIHKMRPNSALLLIGTGPALTAVQEYVHKKGLQQAVLFLGTRQDVNELLQAMDIFLLPSLFEGLPVAGVEAQAAGLPCAFADTITKEILLSSGTQFLSLRATPTQWAQDIVFFTAQQKYHRKRESEMTTFNIKTIVKRLEKLYESKR